MRRSLFLFLMIFCAWLKVNSTGQVGDFIVIGNDTLAMLSLPIEVDSVLRLNVSQQIREVYPDGYITSCWRKYIATWKMEEEKLYLEDIMICPLEPIFLSL
ncbi:MAG: hypothetical protein GX905_07545 [Bacteroidales bacterium]|nr:hypothetical protein [Bacteroidales bacterium]